MLAFLLNSIALVIFTIGVPVFGLVGFVLLVFDLSGALLPRGGLLFSLGLLPRAGLLPKTGLLLLPHPLVNALEKSSKSPPFLASSYPICSFLGLLFLGFERCILLFGVGELPFTLLSPKRTI